MTDTNPPDESLPITDTARNVGAVIDRVRFQGKHVQITRNRKRAAMIVPIEWYDRAIVATPHD
jgi:prevent-host-death family protein